MYINIYSNKLLNFYIHIDIFKIIETCYYWLHIIQFPLQISLKRNTYRDMKGKLIQLLEPVLSVS